MSESNESKPEGMTIQVKSGGQYHIDENGNPIDPPELDEELTDAHA